MASEVELCDTIASVKATLATLGDLRPGSLSVQYNVCGSPRCRCKAEPPQRHGPYHYLSYTRKGHGHTETVSAEHLAGVADQIANYRKLRDLIDRWVDASIELDRLRRRSP